MSVRRSFRHLPTQLQRMIGVQDVEPDDGPLMDPLMAPPGVTERIFTTEILVFFDPSNLFSQSH